MIVGLCPHPVISVSHFSFLAYTLSDRLDSSQVILLRPMTRLFIQMSVFAYHFVVMSLRSFLHFQLYYMLVWGFTPISEISTRAFVAYSWFGLPPCVHSQEYIWVETQVCVGARS